MIIGETISHYRVLALLGAGGMGEVYKAEDTRLRRPVALKLLPIGLVQDADAKARLVHEAQAASALDHPNICTIHEIDETPDGRMFVAMAYYEGDTLKQRIASGPMSIDEAIDIVSQVARAVAAAHDAGIIHRDIKPANIMLTRRGEVKLLDFGVAKLVGQTALTRTGTTLGTVAYMAPEQFTGVFDGRSDVWALGVVLYECLTGRLPFAGEHELAMMRAIADDPPRPLREARPAVPPPLESAIARALQKDPRARYASAGELLQDLQALRPGPATATVAATGQHVPQPIVTRRRALVGGVALLLGVTAAGFWIVQRNERARVGREGLSRLAALIQKEDFPAAFHLMKRLEPALSQDPEFNRLRDVMSLPASIHSTPAGADLSLRSYTDPNAEWIHLGRSPLDNWRGPLGYYRWRVSKDGFETLDGADGAVFAEITFTLAPKGSVPEGMVPVSGTTVQIPGAGGVPLADFFIDRYEVTNRDFKRFVDAGGYRKPDYWSERFVKDGRVLTWAEAMTEFRDPTGKPGPSTWELGAYPAGQDDFPVRGVSWYEAAAYARFAERSLPTVHHWRQAAAFGIYSEIVTMSNFSGKGPARVGAYQGVGKYGTYDMAGNVKEWCSNETGGLRYILGGAWNEPVYQYRGSDARSPFDRSEVTGFRTMKVADPSALSAALLAPIEDITRNYAHEKPVNDETFRIFQGLFAYDRTDLKPLVESTDDSPESWRMERITYAAAYGGERIIAYLLLPKQVKPPYQAVVYFPHSGGTFLRSFDQAEMRYLGFIVKGGRALMFPMYKGTYERRLVPPATGLNAIRDLNIQQVKDLERSIDYLETRKDIDSGKLAYFGVSLGAFFAPLPLALEPRLKAAVVYSGGLPLNKRAAEVDPINFAPRVKQPILMLNGRDDFTFPIESSQLPMLRLLGTPDADKKHVLYDGGHVFPFARIVKDTLDWLDKYLGTP